MFKMVQKWQIDDKTHTFKHVAPMPLVGALLSFSQKATMRFSDFSTRASIDTIPFNTSSISDGLADVVSLKQASHTPMILC